MSDSTDVTALLQRARQGDAGAQAQLAPLVYQELKMRAERLMAREAAGHSLQATMLVNDAFLRLVDTDRVDWESRGHFFALAARVMRRVLVEHARARNAGKRGGGKPKVQLDEALTVSVDHDEDILRVEAALVRLAEVNPARAELVTMRFFGGLTVAEIAAATGVPKRTCEREWTLVKAWLRRELAQ